MKKYSTFYLYRSSITGKFVSEKYAEKHPKTTFKTRIRRRER